MHSLVFLISILDLQRLFTFFPSAKRQEFLFFALFLLGSFPKIEFTPTILSEISI